MTRAKRKYTRGFTIVELLIVIVVIAVLAAIVIVAYNGVQTRARQSKITSDLAQLEKAIGAARTIQNKPLYNITGNSGTAYGCTIKADGTNLAALAKTDTCWADYLDTLDAISTVGGANVRGLVDPWGRPYYIDENENQDDSGSCNKDVIGSYRDPFVGGWTFANPRELSNTYADC
jgi:prepilin-type N-terminal cleavage/methylation domain-containing protein